MSDIEYTVIRDDLACAWTISAKLELCARTAILDKEVVSLDDWQRVLEERKDALRCFLWNMAEDEFSDIGKDG